MIVTIVFFIFLMVNSSSQDIYDEFRKYDYCQVNCPPPLHSACNCTPSGPPREEITDHMDEFRQIVVDVHNQDRNEVASGKARKKYPMVKSAADMMKMEYDMELEYIARCLAINSFEGKHDRCRKTHDGKSAGQNLVGISVQRDVSKIPSLIQLWYNEIVDILDPAIFDAYDPANKAHGKTTGHFFQMVWGSANLVGCARVWNPELKIVPYRFAVICNYGSSIGSSGNLIGAHVYKKGRPCSACPPGTSRDTKYTSLCGKSGKHRKSSIILIVILLIFVYAFI